MIVSTADAYIKRSQLGNKNWKQHEESRHVGSIFYSCAVHKGGTWSNKSGSKVMRYQRMERAVHRLSTADAYIKRSQLDKKEITWKHDCFRSICGCVAH